MSAKRKTNETKPAIMPHKGQRLKEPELDADSEESTAEIIPVKKVPSKTKATAPELSPEQEPKADLPEGKTVAQLAEEAKARQAANEAAKPEPTKSKKVITPAVPAKQPEPVTPSQTSETEKQPDELRSASSPSEDEPEKADDTEPPEQTAESEAVAKADAVAAAEKAETEKEATVQKLVESKQYYLPIETVEVRRSKRIVVLGVAISLLLALTWVNIALDAELIQLGDIKPLTNFF